MRYKHDKRAFAPTIWRNIILRQGGKKLKPFVIEDVCYSIPIDHERLFIWIKEYIDYSRSDLLAMDVKQFYALVNEADRKHEMKLKNPSSKK